MRQSFTRVFSATIRGIDPQSHRVTALVNTASVDRHRTIFLPAAFEQALPTYLASNPIFLWGHQQHGQPEDALGIAVEGRATPNGPEVTFEYAVGANPKAARVWDLVQAGVIRAFSIGGYVLGAVDRRSPKEELATIPDWARQALEAGDADAVFTDLELVEVSQVLIGSNREALLKAVSDGTLSREMIARALEGENGESEMKTDSTAPAGQAEERNVPQPETRMDVRMRGCAARLCNLADCLQLRRWYDESTEDQQQTLQGFLEELDDVRSIVVGELAEPAGEEASDAPADATSPEPARRAGAVISKASREKLQNAKTKCQEAIGHLDELIGDDEEQPAEEAAPATDTAETRTPSRELAALVDLIRDNPAAALALLEKTFS